MGSSPRVWGQVECLHSICKDSRIIPTRMGTSIYRIIFCRNRRDHPHAYGDKVGAYNFVMKWLGSSPRVWGQGYQLFPVYRLMRIIPTRMGTRPTGSGIPPGERDHPHAYGDKHLKGVTCFGTRGSSPRVWGQETFCPIISFTTGIIPTRMGTSL